MSGWKIVPVEPTEAQLEAVATCNGGRLFAAHARAFYLAGQYAAPEPDWEALAEEIYDASCNHVLGRAKEKLAEVLKATFGGVK